MSDGAVKRRSASGQARQRRKGTQRGGQRARAIVATRGAGSVDDSAPAGTATRTRRASLATVHRAPVLTREAEYAFIRSDMRRLIIIAVGLLALMLIILYVVER